MNNCDVLLYDGLNGTGSGLIYLIFALLLCSMFSAIITFKQECKKSFLYWNSFKLFFSGFQIMVIIATIGMTLADMHNYRKNKIVSTQNAAITECGK